MYEITKKVTTEMSKVWIQVYPKFRSQRDEEELAKDTEKEWPVRFKKRMEKWDIWNQVKKMFK